MGRKERKEDMPLPGKWQRGETEVGQCKAVHLRRRSYEEMKESRSQVSTKLWEKYLVTLNSLGRISGRGVKIFGPGN